MRNLERPKSIWEDNIRLNLTETDVNARNWIDSVEDRDNWIALANATLNLRIL